MALVSIQQADTYAHALMRANVDSHFEALGVEGDIRPDMKVLIKPNLLAAHQPERVATTHPALIRAIAEWFRDRGVEHITIADSPGGLYKRGNLKAVYNSCGYMPLSDVAKLNDDTGYKTVHCPGGYKNKSFNIINPIVQADYIVNVAKLKTHGLTTISAGVKNLFGSVPGLQKPEWHFKCPKIDDFCQMLIELAQLVSPQITMIDAVQTMEGNGPLNGRMRHMGLTFASRNMYAQDYIAARLMGIDPEKVPILCQSVNLKLCKPDEITLIGYDAQPAQPPYMLPESLTDRSHNFLLKALKSVGKRVYCAIPEIDTIKCTGCGKCAESCPMKIITINDRKASISVKTCISCFCCQEMCPADAVKVRHVLRLPKI